MRRALTLCLSLLFVFSAAGCDDDDDPTGPDGLELFVGTFVATSMIFTPDEGGNPIDVIPLGASLTVTTEANGDFTWSLTAPGQDTETESGVLVVNESSNTVTVDFSDPEEEDIIAVYAFSNSNNTLTLNADDVSFDLDQDGEAEAASVQVVMERQ